MMLNKEKKTITLEFTDYLIRGSATITCWDETQGEVEMKEYHTNSLDFEEVFAGANDNGFGCKSIDEVLFIIYENYEGYLVYCTEFYVDRFPYDKYGKIGI